jgi:hypothetical protein
MMELDEGAKPNHGAQDKGIRYGFPFCIQDTIEGVDGLGSIAVL